MGGVEWSAKGKLVTLYWSLGNDVHSKDASVVEIHVPCSFLNWLCNLYISITAYFPMLHKQYVLGSTFLCTLKWSCFKINENLWG